MPTATVELCRSTPGYDAVAFVPVNSHPLSRFGYSDAARLPEGLYTFGAAGRRHLPTCVVLELPKDRESGTDVTPVLVAADYLRENGWVVELPEWIREMAGGAV